MKKVIVRMRFKADGEGDGYDYVGVKDDGTTLNLRWSNTLFTYAHQWDKSAAKLLLFTFDDHKYVKHPHEHDLLATFEIECENPTTLSVQGIYKQAAASELAGDYDQAIAWYNAALQLLPRNDDILARAGRLCFSFGAKYHDRVATPDQAVDLDVISVSDDAKAPTISSENTPYEAGQACRYFGGTEANCPYANPVGDARATWMDGYNSVDTAAAGVITIADDAPTEPPSEGLQSLIYALRDEFSDMINARPNEHAATKRMLDHYVNWADAYPNVSVSAGDNIPDVKSVPAPTCDRCGGTYDTPDGEQSFQIESVQGDELGGTVCGKCVGEFNRFWTLAVPPLPAVRLGTFAWALAQMVNGRRVKQQYQGEGYSYRMGPEFRILLTCKDAPGCIDGEYKWSSECDGHEEIINDRIEATDWVLAETN